MAVIDPNNARIKMVALTPNGLDNIRWHSLEKYNESSTSDKVIIAGMLRRLKAYSIKHKIEVNVVQFYDCKTDVLIIEYR